MTESFSKSETLRRLRILAALARRAEHLRKNALVEVGLRTTPHSTPIRPLIVLDMMSGDPSDDLDANVSLNEAKTIEVVQRVGAIVHLYTYDVPVGRPDEGELTNTVIGWMGTCDEQPVLVNVPGMSNEALARLNGESN